MISVIHSYTFHRCPGVYSWKQAQVLRAGPFLVTQTLQVLHQSYTSHHNPTHTLCFSFSSVRFIPKWLLVFPSCNSFNSFCRREGGTITSQLTSPVCEGVPRRCLILPGRLSASHLIVGPSGDTVSLEYFSLLASNYQSPEKGQGPHIGPFSNSRLLQ